VSKIKTFILVVIIFISSIPLVVVGAVLFWFNLPHIYTPPALTPENVTAYNRCIEFIRNHDVPKRFICLAAFDDDPRKNEVVKGKVYIGEICKMLADPSVSVKRKLKARESWDKRVNNSTRLAQQKLESEIQKIAYQLLRVKCVRFHKEDDMILFYKTYGPLESASTGPGVVYSLAGRDPSEVKSEALDLYRPFIKIGGNWYMSRHLLLIGPRFKMNHASNPESLIDRSLRTKGLNLGEGDK